VETDAVSLAQVTAGAQRRFGERERCVAAHHRSHMRPRRVGEPDDIARVVSLLLDPRASWITGQVIVADGGLSLV
jgi:NAD(P)-dependent dehydrogenase (short-subunit alcohol dehydrogenase family)